MEDVLDQTGQLEVVPDERGILRNRIGRHRPAVHPRVNDGRPRKQTIPKLYHEAAGGGSDRHHQVRLPFRQPLEQELDEHFFHVRLPVASHVQGDLVKINALPHLLGQRGFERGRVGRERWRAAPEGMHHEDALRACGIGGV